MWVVEWAHMSFGVQGLWLPLKQRPPPTTATWMFDRMHLPEVKVGWVQPVAEIYLLKISRNCFFFQEGSGFCCSCVNVFHLQIRKECQVGDMSSFFRKMDYKYSWCACVECNSWTRKLWDLLFICYNSRCNLRTESIVDIFPFKCECHLESLIWAAAFSGVIRLLSFLILSDSLFSSPPPSSHSSAASSIHINPLQVSSWVSIKLPVSIFITFVV